MAMKGQKDKQRSTKHTHKTKDRVTRSPLKTVDELRCSGRISSSCSISGTSQGNPDRNHKLWNIVSTERYIPYAGAA
jgi:hypothetical protein